MREPSVRLALELISRAFHDSAASRETRPWSVISTLDSAKPATSDTCVRLVRLVGHHTAVTAAKAATRPNMPRRNLRLGQAAVYAAVTRGAGAVNQSAQPNEAFAPNSPLVRTSGFPDRVLKVAKEEGFRFASLDDLPAHRGMP